MSVQIVKGPIPGMSAHMILWPTEVRESEKFKRTIAKQTRAIKVKLARQAAKRTFNYTGVTPDER